MLQGSNLVRVGLLPRRKTRRGITAGTFHITVGVDNDGGV